MLDLSYAVKYTLMRYLSDYQHVVCIVLFSETSVVLDYLISFQYAAAKIWTKWEMMTAHLLPNDENIKKGDSDTFSLVC